MPKIKEISVADLARMLRNEDHFDLLDIRTQIEMVFIAQHARQVCDTNLFNLGHLV
jgi:hypothetical protein